MACVKGTHIEVDSLANRCGTCQRTMGDCSEAGVCLGWKPDEVKIELVQDAAVYGDRSLMHMVKVRD